LYHGVRSLRNKCIIIIIIIIIIIVSGTPKREIQVNVKALAHAAADVQASGIASIHLDVRSVMVKI
jgi:hypothetical protein